MQKENWPVPQWRLAGPGEQGINPELPRQLHSVITSEYGNTNGILVVRNGCIVYEEYLTGLSGPKPLKYSS